MRDIHCPKDIGFENTFIGEDCQKDQFYNNCYHCWSTALAKGMDKWIPVSKKLPKDRREVLVTAYWHETYQVMMGSYYGDGLWWCVPFNNCGEHMQRLKPKAWMPLPKPYEPKEDE